MIALIGAASTPVPLSIANDASLQGEQQYIDILRATFRGANFHLGNLQRILRPVPREAPGSITKTRRDTVLRHSFGNLDDMKRSLLCKRIDKMLHYTTRLTVAKVREDYKEMEAETRNSHALAYYEPDGDHIVFTVFFYNLNKRCREHVLIHEAAHALFGAYDFFKEVYLNPNDPNSGFYYTGAYEEDKESDPSIISGYEHEQLNELIVLSQGFTLFNAESYAQAAIRATLIIEHGIDHPSVTGLTFEECDPDAVRSRSSSPASASSIHSNAHHFVVDEEMPGVSHVHAGSEVHKSGILHRPKGVASTPLPLSIANDASLQGEQQYIETLRVTFRGANVHLQNLQRILRPVPLEAPDSITKVQRDTVLQHSFGRLDDVQRSFLCKRIDQMLANTAQLLIKEVRLDYKKMGSKTRDSHALAYYRPAHKDLVFTAYFYALPTQRCREHVLIHEAAHALFGAYDFFKEVYLNPSDPDSEFYYIGAYEDSDTGSDPSIVNGLDTHDNLHVFDEHEQLNELIEYSKGFTLFNAESYAQAAIRATLITEHGHTHPSVSGLTFEECDAPSPPSSPVSDSSHSSDHMFVLDEEMPGVSHDHTGTPPMRSEALHRPKGSHARRVRARARSRSRSRSQTPRTGSPIHRPENHLQFSL
ncbi:hypothetical protein CVT24_000907 [Panaeolus cyanescens]|uniref:Uncharacterized protein n=1 Tax=Panaeolus cyanescens TaxID=181874 RepID=A0A409YY41_9AGAR|nr:hypothetical protein CVT24_000907 [Panaeolus cyanescens]